MMLILLQVCNIIDGQELSDIAVFLFYFIAGVKDITTMEGFQNVTNITMCMMVHGPGI